VLFVALPRSPRNSFTATDSNLHRRHEIISGCQGGRPFTADNTRPAVTLADAKKSSNEQREVSEGWNEEKVRRVLAYYRQQTEEEALIEDEAGVESSETVMNVPHELVPKIRELIAKRHR